MSETEAQTTKKRTKKFDTCSSSCTYKNHRRSLQDSADEYFRR